MKIELETNKWRFESHVNENELRFGNETSIRIIIYYHVYDINIARGYFIFLSLGGYSYKDLFYFVLTNRTSTYHVFIAVQYNTKKDTQSSVWKQR